MKTTLVNGYEIVYRVDDASGTRIIETTNKDAAVNALVDHPGARLSTRALGRG